MLAAFSYTEVTTVTTVQRVSIYVTVLCFTILHFNLLRDTGLRFVRPR